MIAESPPTRRSAVLAGVFSALTFSPIDAWLHGAGQSLPSWLRALIWIGALIPLFAVPFYLYAIGREPIWTTNLWSSDVEQRSRVIAYLKRGCLYILGALGAALALAAIILARRFLAHR